MRLNIIGWLVDLGVTEIIDLLSKKMLFYYVVFRCVPNVLTRLSFDK